MEHSRERILSDQNVRTIPEMKALMAQHLDVHIIEGKRYLMLPLVIPEAEETFYLGYLEDSAETDIFSLEAGSPKQIAESDLDTYFDTEEDIQSAVTISIREAFDSNTHKTGDL